MGRKRNLGPHRLYGLHKRYPRCMVCGGRTSRVVHIKCKGKRWEWAIREVVQVPVRFSTPEDVIHFWVK